MSWWVGTDSLRHFPCNRMWKHYMKTAKRQTLVSSSRKNTFSVSGAVVAGCLFLVCICTACPLDVHQKKKHILKYMSGAVIAGCLFLVCTCTACPLNVHQNTYKKTYINIHHRLVAGMSFGLASLGVRLKGDSLPFENFVKRFERTFDCTNHAGCAADGLFTLR